MQRRDFLFISGHFVHQRLLYHSQKKYFLVCFNWWLLTRFLMNCDFSFDILEVVWSLVFGFQNFYSCMNSVYCTLYSVHCSTLYSSPWIFFFPALSELRGSPDGHALAHCLALVLYDSTSGHSFKSGVVTLISSQRSCRWWTTTAVTTFLFTSPRNSMTSTTSSQSLKHLITHIVQHIQFTNIPQLQNEN